MEFAIYAGFSRYILENGFDKAAAYAKELDFSAVEMLADKKYNPVPDVETAKQAKAVFDKYGLKVACHSVCVNLWNDIKTHGQGPKQNITVGEITTADRADEKFLMRQVEVAAALGSPYVHHTLLPWLTLPVDAPEYGEAIETAVEAAVRVADYAATFGITCIYEDQGYYVNGVEGLYGFFSKMKARCKNVGICGDLGNILFVNETPESFLEAYIKDVCHVHIKDYLWKKAKVSPGIYWYHAKDDSWLRDTMIGNGVVDFDACMKLLKDAGYQGYFSLENAHPEPYEDGVKQAMEYLKRFW